MGEGRGGGEMGQTLSGAQGDSLPPAPAHQGRGSFARNRFSTGGTIYRVVDVTVDKEDILEARKPC